MCISNTEFKTKEFMLYELENNIYIPADRYEKSPYGCYKQIDFAGLPVYPIKGFSFSDRHILAWTESICYVYEQETGITKLLSF